MRILVIAAVLATAGGTARAGEMNNILVGAGPGFSTRPGWVARVGNLFLDTKDGAFFAARSNIEVWSDRVDSGGGYSIGPALGIRSGTGFATLGGGVSLFGFASHRSDFYAAWTAHAAASFGMFLGEERGRKRLIELQLRYERHLVAEGADTNMVSLSFNVGFEER